jgi:uncharacterized membrane protein YccC
VVTVVTGVAMIIMVVVMVTTADMAVVVTVAAMAAAIGMARVRVNMAAVTIGVDHSSNLDIQREGMYLMST